MRAGLIRRSDAFAAAYMQLRYKLSGASAAQMERMRDHICARCTGWDVAVVRDVVSDHLPGIVPAILYAEAVHLMHEHRRAGHDIVIISSSGEEVVLPIGAILGADTVIATRMGIRDGRYSGEIDFYCVGEHKVTAMHELAASAGYNLAQCYAYSDSVTDLPMLEAVGRPRAVNPDRALRRAARDRGWPVLRFGSRVPVPRQNQGDPLHISGDVA